MDGNSALYMQVGNTFNFLQLNKMISASADAFASRQSSGAKSRSKPMVHVVGPGLHHTHPPVAAVFGIVKQLLRLLEGERSLSRDDFLALSPKRASCRGLVKALLQALKFLKVDWKSAFVFKRDDKLFSFDPQTRPTTNKLLHLLRAFLRDAVLAKEAARRPRDFAGLERGWDTREEVRANTYSLWHRRSGPSIVCGNVWTRAKIYRANRSWTDRPSCVRCQKKVETLSHRLFGCEDNKGFWDHHLKPVNITLTMVHDLPVCTRRCGIFVADNDWEVAQVKALQDYMVAVNSYATTAYDNFRKGHGLDELTPDFSGKKTANDPSTIYKVAIPPIRKRKHKLGEPEDDGSRSGWVTLPVRIMHHPQQQDGKTWLYTDGSFTPPSGGFQDCRCGWGFCVLGASPGPVVDMCGPVDLDGPLSEIQVTEHLSNNVGELCAILHGLCWVSHQTGITELVIYSDSDYAIKTIRKFWRPKTNIPLILMCQTALLAVEDKGIKIEWTKVVSHTGDTFNERADRLARCGGQGTRHYDMEVMVYITNFN